MMTKIGCPFWCCPPGGGGGARGAIGAPIWHHKCGAGFCAVSAVFCTRLCDCVGLLFCASIKGLQDVKKCFRLQWLISCISFVFLSKREYIFTVFERK